MRLTLQISGLEPAASRLEELAQALARPAAPLLGAVGELWAEAFRSRLRQGQPPPGLSWPSLHWLTLKIRRHYGHGGPRLVRRGDLVESITTLEQGPSHVSVGTRLPGASRLQRGGTSRLHGRPVAVQAFPFIHLDRHLVAKTVEAIRRHYFPESLGEAP